MGKARGTAKQRKIIKKWPVDFVILGQAMLLTVVIAFLFYRSILGVFCGILIIPFWTKLMNQQKKASYHSRLRASIANFFWSLRNTCFLLYLD